MWTSGFDYSRQVPCYFLMGCTLRALSFNLDPFMFVTFFSALQSIAVGNRRISNCLRCEQWKKEKKKKSKNKPNRHTPEKQTTKKQYENNTHLLYGLTTFCGIALYSSVKFKFFKLKFSLTNVLRINTVISVRKHSAHTSH